jgi:putative transposase
MQQFKEGKRVDFNNTERKVYAKYREYLKVNASQVCRKNAEAWRSFFALLREKKEDKSLKPRPPSYWKGERKVILIRNDRYAVDEGSRTIYLKDFHLSLRFKGRLKWKGKQGRLEIFHDGFHWYATIPVEVELNAKTKGNGIAGIDLGIVNLATVAFDDGTWVLFKGGSLLSEYENYSRKIALTQKKLSAHGQTRSKKLKALYLKRKRFLKHALNSLVRRILKIAYDKGVSTIRVGYPRKIAQRHGNKLTVNFWNYNYIIKRLMEVSEEYGIKVIPVNEAYTSHTCSLCGEVHDSGRVFRGLFKCPHTGRTINADLNGAINILHIPESQGGWNEGFSPSFSTGSTRGIGVNWLKTQPLVYRWTSGAGWATPTSYETMKVKAVNHKPVNRSKGTLTL